MSVYIVISSKDAIHLLVSLQVCMSMSVYVVSISSTFAHIQEQLSFVSCSLLAHRATHNISRVPQTVVANDANNANVPLGQGRQGLLPGVLDPFRGGQRVSFQGSLALAGYGEDGHFEKKFLQGEKGSCCSNGTF